jgi:hypothetical protein
MSSRKKKPKTPKEDKIKTELGADLQSGKDFYSQYFPTEALQHYEDPQAVEDQNLVNLRQAYADPHNESFAGNMSQDDKWALGNLRGQMDPNSSSYVGKNSADISDIINRFKSGLDGYTAAENAGLREQSERGLDATAATMRYNAQRDAARNRVRGAAAGAQMGGINRDRLRAGRELEQDIFLKNADEKQNRLKTFADFTRTNDDTNYQRSNLAGRDFRDFLKDREDTAYGRGQDAIGSYEQSLGALGDKRFQIGQFNIGQDEKTSARDVGTQMGLVSLLGTRRSAEEQNAILKKK